MTPGSPPKGRVQLYVGAQRTALNASSHNPRVAYQIEIGETPANANVVMNMGDTQVLSGLSEKSSSSTRNSAPSLQDPPGIQHLFCNRKTINLQRAVLFLVTSRAPEQIGEVGAGDPMTSRMMALREHFGFADSAQANIEAVMTQLQGNGFFREFSQGDMSLERGDRMRSTGDRLKEALGFLHY